MRTKSYFGYWGKLDKDTESRLTFHQLAYHSLDVAAVTYLFLTRRHHFLRDMARFLGIEIKGLQQLITIVAVLHDLGKFASAFQGLIDHQSADLVSVRPRRPYDSRDAHHDRLGYVFWKHLQKPLLAHVTGSTALDRRLETRAVKTLTVLMECSLGHHGQPINTQQWQFLEHDYLEPHNIEAATEFFSDISHLFPVSISLAILTDDDVRKRLQQLSWHIAGVVVLADWVGSNRDYFSYRSETLSLGEYWPDALEKADIALQQTELGSIPKVCPFLSVEQHFSFIPTPLQAWAETVSVDDTPQLFILEDVTGAGKTEAALVLTHRLLQADAADGFYFGLPTMATSNAMCSPHLRG